MHSPALIATLDRFPRVLEALVRPLADADVRWKPEDGAWSILEVLAHLADEEVEDFRARVQRTLDNPSAAWDPIDPEGVAVARTYNTLDPAHTLDRFVRERAASITWLRALECPDWSRAFAHSKFGPMHAGMLLTSWAAHDLLHLRQITKRLFQLTERDGEPYPTIYAGQWIA